MTALLAIASYLYNLSQQVDLGQSDLSVHNRCPTGTALSPSLFTISNSPLNRIADHLLWSLAIALQYCVTTDQSSHAGRTWESLQCVNDPKPG